jgi:hypothetical protein
MVKKLPGRKWPNGHSQNRRFCEIFPSSQNRRFGEIFS